MSPAALDVDPDVYLSAGRRFLEVNEAACDIVASTADTANGGGAMAGVDTMGVAWSRSYDGAAAALLRAGASVVDALGVLGDRLTASGTNHDDAEVASVPRAGAGPPTYPGSPGTSRAVGVVVSPPPSADGTPTDPPPGWAFIAHLIAYTWPAGHPGQLRDVGAGWLSASLTMSEQADRLSGPISDLSGQTSPEVPYALAICTGLQSTLRTVADQCAVVAHACTGYANRLDQSHHDVIEELVDLVETEAVIEILGGVLSGPSAGLGEIPTQAVAGARISAAALRVGRILSHLADEVLTLENLVSGVNERVVSVLVALEEVAAERETLQAVTDLIDQGIPPVDLQANERDNPTAHVIERHVAKTDQYLMNRAAAEGKAITSTFTSLAAATTAVSTLIAAYEPEITAWLAGNGKSFRFNGPLAPGAGRSYDADQNMFVTSTKIFVKLGRKGNGFYIVTAFPGP